MFYNPKNYITGYIDFLILCKNGLLGIGVKDWSLTCGQNIFRTNGKRQIICSDTLSNITPPTNLENLIKDCFEYSCSSSVSTVDLTAIGDFIISCL